MSCDEALTWPWMKDAGFGEPLVLKFRHLRPYRAVFLTATPERAPPDVEDIVPERCDGPIVRRHRMVVEEAPDARCQPSPLIGSVGMDAAAQLLLDLLELRFHAVAPGLPVDEESAVA